ncbi:MAG: DoxX family protein [Alphaproteobacteria bacterium]|nr:DoxX family protein [Alphaproteobacteria bacterium]TAD90205.1 MAG: DoxX family protein [Alphaproteobacteria bacterium]
MTDVRTVDYGITLLRVSLGVLLLAHGLLKIFVFTLPGTVGFFQSLGYPGVMAYLVVAVEVVAGLMMIAGLWTRWAALAAIPVLIGATMVHLGNGWLFSNPKGGWEFPAFWTVALAAQALLGDGAFRASALLPGNQPRPAPAA